MSMRTLSTSDEPSQIAVALNLIKVIIEHNINDHKYENVEDIMNAVEDGRIQRGQRRWYDIESTVRTVIQMLEKCAPETKQKVALDMAQLVIEKIIQDVDDDESEEIEEEKTPVVTTDEDESTVLDLDAELKNKNE